MRRPDDRPTARRLRGPLRLAARRALGLASAFRLRPLQVLNNELLLVSVLALLVGGLTGVGIILFREGIAALQRLTYGGDTEALASTAAALPWWMLLGIPVAGGLLVGLWHRATMPDGRPETVSHVMEAAMLRGGRMPLGRGLAAAVGSMLSLGMGASVGREGPAVHLGATLGAAVAKTFRFGRGVSRTLLGCGAAAAVAASFNAPIAGALFAHEVVVGHYAASAFAPVVISSLAGTVVSRLWFGAEPAFALPPDLTLTSALEFPAFALLGVVCGVVAVLFMGALTATDWAARQTRLPSWQRPALAGAALGLIAMAFPEVLGVGYEVTNRALTGALLFDAALLLAVAKVVATAVCLGFGFGGGVFSPSLALGAIVGCAFGIMATSFGPEGLSSGPGAYAVVGMGAIAAAVLGAPISTSLIIFELTANYALTGAVMMAVVVATVVAHGIVGHRSLFHWQLSRRGLNLHVDRQRLMLREQRVNALMRSGTPTVPPDASTATVADAFRSLTGDKLYVVDADRRLLGTITLKDAMAALLDDEPETRRTALDLALTDPPVLKPTDSLEEALSALETLSETEMAVVQDRASMMLVGTVRDRDVMRAQAEALSRLQAEDRGDAR
jgi:CIC family chloride channel protein